MNAHWGMSHSQICPSTMCALPTLFKLPGLKHWQKIRRDTQEKQTWVVLKWPEVLRRHLVAFGLTLHTAVASLGQASSGEAGLSIYLSSPWCLFCCNWLVLAIKAWDEDWPAEFVLIDRSKRYSVVSRRGRTYGLRGGGESRVSWD